MPNKGANFCTFSGQAIASIKIYKEFKKRGAYLDLDLHQGNSIEYTRGFNKTINRAIPKGFNFNPKGKYKYYIYDLQDKLNQLENGIKNGKIDYVVVAHGANSHIEDDMMGLLTTEQWLECSRMVYNTLSLYDIPIIISLFGGCREDDYDNVLKLHTADLIEAINILTCQCIDYNPTITKNKGRQEFLKNTSNIKQYVRFQ
jgi:acetoin utilization deacetylase AcuC-like enzyme